MREGYYIIAGYLAGSILFASVFGQLFCHKDITEESKDYNPGTANAFMYGGVLCGVLTLCCDLLKGFLPVYAYFHEGVEPGPLLCVGGAGDRCACCRPYFFCVSQILWR